MLTLEFNKIFSGHKKAGSNINKSDLYPIQNAEILLDEEAIKYLIKDLKKELMIPDNAFADIYLAVINKYAEFVQSLPNLKHHNFSFQKGQLFLALIRANITLETSYDYSCPVSDKKLLPIEEEKRNAVWHFAIFSSSLILDIGRSITRFVINTCTDKAENVTPWFPLGGPMTLNNANSHYIYQVLEPIDKNYAHKLNLLIAKLIIPEYIFGWLYSEQDIFFEWLSLLEDEASGSGTLHKLTVVSLRRLLNEYMGSTLPSNILHHVPIHLKKKQEYHKDSFWKGVEFSLRGKSHKESQAEQNAGVEFLNWLKEGIKDKSISVNQKDSKVHISTEGVFLVNPEIFLDFCNQFPRHPNWLSVFKQFNQLGLSKVTNNSSIFQAQFPYLDKPDVKRGIIIKDAKDIFGDIKLPGISPELSTDPAQQITNSKVFPTPREEVGSYLRHIFKPKIE